MQDQFFECVSAKPGVGSFCSAYAGGFSAVCLWRLRWEYGFDASRAFEIPFQWLLLVLLAVYINFDLTEESSAGVYVQLLLRAGDKKQYWLSKMLCIAVGTGVYFVLGVTVTLICGLALGGVPTLEIDPLILSVMHVSSMVPREADSPGFIPALLMVWFAILTVALLQQFVSLLIKPIGSFLVTAVFVFLSAYFMTPVFFGSYAMMIRSALLCEGGVSAVEGILILSLVSLASIAGGCIVYDRKDILSKGES